VIEMIAFVFIAVKGKKEKLMQSGTSSLRKSKRSRKGRLASHAAPPQPTSEHATGVLAVVAQGSADQAHQEPGNANHPAERNSGSSKVSTTQEAQPTNQTERVELKATGNYGTIEVRMLPTASIDPNNLNPNAMTKDQYAQLKAEVKLLGHPPKPIVVCQRGDRFIVVDGNHSLRATNDLGMQAVPCEVVEADAFEAERQVYARNHHGTMNPVRTGQMFTRMMASKGLKQRQLAVALNRTEGTVRYYLRFAEAAKLRNNYAPNRAEAQICDLNAAEVQNYLDRSDAERDKWLDKVLADKKSLTSKRTRGAKADRRITPGGNRPPKAEDESTTAPAGSAPLRAGVSADQGDQSPVASTESADGADRQPAPRQASPHQQERQAAHQADANRPNGEGDNDLAPGPLDRVLGMIRSADQALAGALPIVETDGRRMFSAKDKALLAEPLLAIETTLRRLQAVIH
jgi:hypothetical protein